MINDPEFRRQVSGMLGTPVTDAMWAYARAQQGWLDQDTTPADLAYRLREVLKAASTPLPPPNAPSMIIEETKRRAARSHPSARERRMIAISKLLAEDARQNEKAVKDFRQSMLGGRLLEWEDVGTWVRRQAADDGPPGRDPRAVFLEYGVPDDHWMRLQPAAKTGVLGSLRVLAARLAKRYGWQEAQATLFVLTDMVPRISPLRAEMNWTSPFEAMSRITLTVDPALPPREVAAAYREVRSRFLGPRYRALGEKHIALALFEATKQDGITWREAMLSWNAGLEKHHKKWSYSQETNFARDCTRALKRLLHPNLELRLNGGGRND